MMRRDIRRQASCHYRALDAIVLYTGRVSRETLQLRTTAVRITQPLLLEVVDGPDAGRRYGPLELPIRIGSAPGNEVVLSDPTVSRHHCTLEEASEGILLRDTGSTNGVRLGGHRVLIGVLIHGSSMTLGQTVLAVSFGEARPISPETTPASFGQLHTRSPAMQVFLRTLEQVAKTKVPVLIEGETGTGTEQVVEALHAQGPRPEGPLVVVDLGAASPTFIDRALFGHEPGELTGVEPPRAGALLAANGGTVFLDGIGDLPLELQPKLLRALESETVTPAGAAAAVPFEARIVAATHRNLRQMVNQGTFREDLYFRLAVCPVRAPALRERREDISMLAHEIFVDSLKLLEESPDPVPELEPAAVAWLERQPWPGNVRELRNVIQRAVILGAHEDVQAGRLMSSLEQIASEHLNDSPRMTLETAKQIFVRSYLLDLLHRHHGDRAAAAFEADIHIKSLQRLVRRHGLKGEVP